MKLTELKDKKKEKQTIIFSFDEGAVSVFFFFSR